METALCLLYLIMGCWSIGYIKHDFLGWTTFTTSLGSYYISNMALGFCFGFLTIPFALLHMLVFSKKQLDTKKNISESKENNKTIKSGIGKTVSDFIVCAFLH